MERKQNCEEKNKFALLFIYCLLFTIHCSLFIVYMILMPSHPKETISNNKLVKVHKPKTTKRKEKELG